MNSVNLMGRICKEVEVKTAQSGTAHLSFTLAVTREYKKEGEERQSDFISCKAFGKTAEFIGKYFGKGSLVAVGGKIQTGSYDNKEGVKIYTTDIFVDKVYFTGEKKGDAFEAVGELVDTGNELPF
jgi:single-strand DNA-binding protein